MSPFSIGGVNVGREFLPREAQGSAFLQGHKNVTLHRQDGMRCRSGLRRGGKAGRPDRRCDGQPQHKDVTLAPGMHKDVTLRPENDRKLSGDRHLPCPAQGRHLAQIRPPCSTYPYTIAHRNVTLIRTRPSPWAQGSHLERGSSTRKSPCHTQVIDMKRFFSALMLACI
jgi:hypothetical protein